MGPISLYIVEDELLITASLKNQLENYGYLVLGASTKCDVCLRELEELKIKGQEPEIVLMDIHIRGEIDGIETARIISQRFDCGIIFITGQSSKEVYERSFSIKPFGYLLKPIDLEQTKMTIEIAAYQRMLEMENKKYQKDLIEILESITKEKEEAFGLYQTVVDNSLMGLVIMQDEKFVFANHWAAKIFGYTREEFLSFRIQDIIGLLHPEDREHIVEISRRRLNGEDEPQGTRFRVMQKNGNIIEVLTFVKAITYRNRPALHQSFINLSNL